MTTAAAGFVEEVTAIVGAAHVSADEATRMRLATDIAGPPPVLPDQVVAPGSVDELNSVMRAAARAGLAVVARGGGMSYTGGYGPTRADTLLLDLRRLDRVCAVYPEDMCVVAEAGCTWAGIDAALAPHNLRLASFGPLSGIAATLGGSLSQHAMFFGAGSGFLVGDALLGLDVVLADGALLSTGALARDGGPPFFRQIAPDLTGLFLGDAGAFGVKARAALRTVKRPKSEACASFAFPTLLAMAKAQVRVAGLGLAAECYGFDEVTNRHLDERGFGVGGSMAIAADLARASRSPVAAARALFQAGTARLAHKQAPTATLHVVVEAESEAVATHRINSVRAAIGAGAQEIADTIPRVTRSRPFRRIRALLGPSGQNWLPVHGIVPASAAVNAIAGCAGFIDAQTTLFAQHRIEVSLLTTAAPGWVLVEPQFFWFDALNPFLQDAILPEQRAEFGTRAADPAARAVVMQARAALRDLLDAAGAVHIQPGKYYAPPLAGEAAARLRQMKALFDPGGRMNPGALGLP
jgi:FAD/FMN-containing dehydrogenase